VVNDEHQELEGEHAEEGQHVEALPHLEPVALGAGEKLRVVASTNIVGDAVSQVGGDAIDLTVLMGLGQDPHSYEPTPADLSQIEMAHVAFVNGFGLEGGLLGLLEPLESGVPIVPVSAGIEPREFEHADEHEEESHEAADQHAHAGGDPHTWMDPNNVEIWAANIAEVLSDLDPANADTYQANAATYVEQLEELDAYIEQQVSRIPPGERKLVTNHEAFGYFADRYGLEVVGTVFIGASELAEPSAGDMADLIEAIKAEGVHAIFVETTVSSQLAEVVADEVGYEVGVYTLYTGSLGEPGSGADTYIGMMHTNVDTILAGLQ
jgi:ABC-type Zn uptake system ZnuABC Zn-binding protein ZnuA